MTRLRNTVRTKRTVPILMYHQVSHRAIPTFRKYTVNVQIFAMQVAWMAHAGYTAVTFETMLAFLQGQGALPRRPVIITFDDGYAECVEHATRILGARKFTAYFYIVAGLMGKSSEWLQGTRERELRLIDWDAAQTLEAKGFHCGAHTMTHPHLCRIDKDACYAELSQSREMLKQRLNHPVNHLAYPHGSYNASVCNMAREIGYVTACTTQRGLAQLDADALLMLQRVPVNGDDSFLSFISKLSTGRAAHEWLAGKRMPQLTSQMEAAR